MKFVESLYQSLCADLGTDDIYVFTIEGKKPKTLCLHKGTGKNSHFTVNAYYHPNAPKATNKQRITDISTVRAFFADFDNGIPYPEPEILRFATYKLQTSPGRFQYVWILTEPVPVSAQTTEFQHYLSDLPLADRAVKDHSRLLRWPFSKRIKDGQVTDVGPIEYTEQPRFSFSSLIDATDFKTWTENAKAKRTQAQERFKSLPAVSDNEFKGRLQKDFEVICTMLKKGSTGSRHHNLVKNLYTIGGFLGAHGNPFTKEELRQYFDLFNSAIEATDGVPKSYEEYESVLAEGMSKPLEMKALSESATDIFGNPCHERLADYIFDLTQGKPFSLSIGRHVNLQSFKYVVGVDHYTNANNKVIEVTPSETWLKNKDKATVTQCYSSPKKPYGLHKDIYNLTDNENSWVYNAFKSHRIEPILPPQSYLADLETLFVNLIPDEQSREHLLKWIAFNYQKKGEKIQHAVFLYSDARGIGKSSVLDFAAKTIGNYTTLNISSLEKGFNSELEKASIVLADEVDINNLKDARAFEERLKAIITGVDMSIEAKGVEARQGHLVCNYMFAGNNLDRINFESLRSRMEIIHFAENNENGNGPVSRRNFKLMKDVGMKAEDGSETLTAERRIKLAYFGWFLNTIDISDLTARAPGIGSHELIYETAVTAMYEEIDTVIYEITRKIARDLQRGGPSIYSGKLHPSIIDREILLAKEMFGCNTHPKTIKSRMINQNKNKQCAFESKRSKKLRYWQFDLKIAKKVMTSYEE